MKRGLCSTLEKDAIATNKRDSFTSSASFAVSVKTSSTEISHGHRCKEKMPRVLLSSSLHVSEVCFSLNTPLRVCHTNLIVVVCEWN